MAAVPWWSSGRSRSIGSDRIEAFAGLLPGKVAGVVDVILIVAGAAIRAVGAATAVEKIPAVHATEHVDAAIADQEVLVGGAGDILDAAEMIRDRPIGHIVGPGDITVRGPAAGQRDRNADVHAAVIGGIDAAAADQGVGAADSLERVIATAAVETLAQAGAEDVVAAAAVEVVVAAAALDDVVALLAVKLVGGGAPDERVVEARAEDVLDADEPVAFGRAADAARGVQVDADARGGVAVEHRVDAVTAVEAVGAAEALERIIAVQAIDDIGCRCAIEGVAAVGSIDGRHRHVLTHGGQVLGDKLLFSSGVLSLQVSFSPRARPRAAGAAARHGRNAK